MMRCNESVIKNAKDNLNNKLSTFNIAGSANTIDLNQELVNNIAWNSEGGEAIINSLKTILDNITTDYDKLLKYKEELSSTKVEYTRILNHTELITKEYR